jgi:hypothetical protein
MPFSLIIALAVSLGIHLAVLFGPEIEMPVDSDTPPIMVELKRQPIPPPLVAPVAKPKPAVAKKTKKPLRRNDETVVRATPVLSVPEPVAEAVESPNLPAGLPSPAEAVVEPVADPVLESAMEPEPVSATVEPRLPPRGMIRYRVDSGDRNFQVGVARQEWEVADGHYRLSSVLETVGVAWLFKAYRLDMESRGQVTADGLRPDSFVIRRNGKDANEKASFDWENMTIRVGNRAEQTLDKGAQDFLSFNYQLGFMRHAEAGSALPLATGKKYSVYRLEVLGDEEIDVPAGKMRTQHLQVPGESIDLWLAYDYLLLPVKIRFVDRNDRVFVQVATQIQTSPP